MAVTQFVQDLCIIGLVAVCLIQQWELGCLWKEVRKLKGEE